MLLWIFAAIGTLGLSGREQYIEVFNNLLVAHELGHWLQEIAQRPLNRWQAEYQANQIMVAFWREYPASSPSAETEMRLANFVAQSPNMPNPMPENTGMSAQDYFNTHLAEIESNSMAYAGFSKDDGASGHRRTARSQLLPNGGNDMAPIGGSTLGEDHTIC